ncbi:MAG: GDP-L-fucose synthase family protein [Planctomycetota bacterium]|jgi:GDP-L-fucose synthase
MMKDTRIRKVFVTGHRGLVGSAIVRRLRSEPDVEVIVAGRETVDLRDQAAVEAFLAEVRPDQIYHVAGKVGGIFANREQPADFLYDNIMIASNVIHAAFRQEVAKLLYLGSSCIYPRLCEQPIQERALLTGVLEPTNEPYAIAKIAGLKLCEAYRRQHGCNFITAMPTNLYGPGDNFDLQNSHVIPALIRKFHEAKLAGTPEVTIWGSGTPRREFLHVDDLADACVFLMNDYDETGTINVGSGRDLSIANLASLIREVVYPEARLLFDASMPDGSPRKLLDVARLAARGWRSRIGLRQGLELTYRWYAKSSRQAKAA